MRIFSHKNNTKLFIFGTEAPSAKEIKNMKKYDLIAIGTGSAMNIVSAVQQSNPEMKIAVIDKDEPGGICLTKGCGREG